MNNNNDKKSAADKVLESIEAGRLKKFSIWHFLIKAIVKIVGIIIISLILLHVVSFIFFMLHRTGAIYSPDFGFHGWVAFFGALPHLLILLSIVFVVVLLKLIGRYSFVYRRPLLYATIGIVLAMVVGGHIIAKTKFHTRLMSYAESNRLPIFGGFYRHYGLQKFQNMHTGIILEMNEFGFVMKNDRNDILTVIIKPETNNPHNDIFAKDDQVFVLGDRKNGTIQAFGVHRIRNR